MSIGLGLSISLEDNHSGLSICEHSLNRAERTPEVVAVSGICRERGESLKTLPDFPETNLPQSSTAVLTETTGTPKKPTDQDLNSYYLDCIEKLFPSEAKSLVPYPSKNCGLWAKIGQCENGHRFAVRIFCGKPYCDICRDIMHHRKIASLLPEAQQLLPAALLVIRPPNELQPFYLNRRERRRLIKAVIEALKSLGYRRGLILIHYFGDDPTKYAFHLNVLVDGGWLEPEQLDDLCRKLRRMIYSRRVIEKWGDKLAVNYHYKPTQGQVYQALKYCTRPTFTQFDGNEHLADSIRGEHTIRRWGRWDEEPKWQLAKSDKKLASLVSLEKGNCPKCGKPIKWGKRLTAFALVLAEGGSQITAGYYELLPIRPPPDRPPIPTNLIELPDGDYRKQSNLVKRHGERASNILSLLDDYEPCP